MSRFDVLDRLQGSKALTPEGADWLKLALDPFHDFNHQVAGYPDTDGSQTVVSCYQYQMDVAAPAGVAGNWDAHVYNLPIARATLMTAGTVSDTWAQFTAAGAPAVTAQQSMFNVTTGASGDILQPVTGAGPQNEYDCVPAVGNDDIAGGISRVLGAGFEVTNTTASLNKQGSVTVYRMPQSTHVQTILATNAAGIESGPVLSERARAPPTALSEINLLKGTRTWDAASGVYVTLAQNRIQNPLVQMSTTALVLQKAGSPGVQANGQLSQTAVLQSNLPPIPSTIVPIANQTMPFDLSGAYFTGLSNATVLTIKVKVYVERAPTFSEANLAVLASPSAPYDVRALGLYSRCISELPVATKVRDNASGDWWRSVLGVLSKVAGPVGMALNTVMPGAGAMGLALQTAASTTSLLTKKSNKKNSPAPTRSASAPAARQPTRNVVVEGGSLAAKGQRRGK